ncbi:ATPase family associated with various cellular activities (AAA) [Saccharopolyspora antimicrobica]|uniref:ATPase family associated with various cellular activities (AAA) n=1 Tax=Saccharopolyspora antimicrobica TaxID=455193 RepID=A0A1I4U3S5_9PSEU|nr:ATP-binding protein [Saccharopolyspora antimicrobica]RKT88667.1 ATPase family protein associated with various cellular activities (AAA) [Saccharopolyspora antimicrobica]SFM83559.1 ATPase family associated with various cellular activities (AAA) [Saccharopolyspora antimicrobica]
MTGLQYLWARLNVVEQRVRALVAARRAVDPQPDDPHRGLYLTPEAVERILAAPAKSWRMPEAVTADLDALAEPVPVLLQLAEDFGLSELDVELLLVALAPEVDVRFEPLYGYLNDDVTRRRPTTGLALELCGMPSAGDGRFRFSPGAPLVSGGLLEVQEPDRPFLSRTLRIPDRVVAHLLGDDSADPVAASLARPADPGEPGALAKRLGAGLDAGVAFVHLNGVEGTVRVAVDALAVSGRAALVLAAGELADEPEPQAALPALVREARLCRAGIVFGPLEKLEPERPERARLLRAVVAATAEVPLFLHGSRSWDPGWARRSPVSIRVEAAQPETRAREWRQVLAVPESAPIDALAVYQLDPDQISRAASVASQLAALEARPVELADVQAGVRAQNGAGLERLARRITPAVGWDDLVLPEPTRNQLTELSLRARHRDRVLGDWAMRPGGGRGRGVIALFAGESGTGKTMSAEVVAADLGMDLYVIDLSTVVDKYVGETEKNLERIFTEAAGVNGVLLFDEADAIFGKRSAVKDAHDRYANVESAYLLQRMESFNGIAILTTNLRANLDEAFTRRLDVIADFPLPDATQREALWDRCLGKALPRAADLDLALCAERFELAGGSIRSCATTAAYLAAANAEPVSMADLITAIRQEYTKLGLLPLGSNFENH